MKKFLTVAIIMLASISTQMITTIPWWSFLAPIFLLGILLPLEKWKVASFLSGFIAGLLVWSLSTLYFATIYKGEIVDKTSNLIRISPFLLYIIIGLIGGVLTGLAFYSGFLLRRGKELPQLEASEN